MSARAFAVLGLFLLSLFALVQPSHSAGFDCNKANTLIEKAICADPELSRLDGAMTQKYWAIYAATAAAERSQLKIDQFRSSDYSMNYCKVADEADIKIAWKMTCLREQAIRTIRYMQERLEWGRTIVVENTVAARGLCASMLDKKKIVWLGGDGNGDQFGLPIPQELDFKDAETLLDNFWDSHFFRMKLDFLNTGHPVEFYSIEIKFHHFEYHWYLVVAPGEEEIIHARVLEAASHNIDDLLEDLSKDLTVEDIGTGMINPVTPYSKKSGKPPLFKSRLIDASNTKIFGGGYTASWLFSYKRKTYLLAQSVNNAGPTVALFRPNPSGGLDLLCYHRAPPSRAVNKIYSVESGNEKNCPVNAKQVTTELDAPGTSHTTQIFAQGWGGIRPVSVIVYANSNHTPEASLSVGALNATTVEAGKSLWQPVADLGFLEHRWVSLVVTETGVFVDIWDDEETGSTYYKVQDDKLTPVCTVKREIIPPTGYPTK